MTKARITVEVGFLNRAEFREFLNKMKSRYGLEYVETKESTYSEFMIRGNYDLLIKLAKVVKSFEQ